MALVLALAMICSLVAPVYAAEEVKVLEDSFDADISAYEIYDAEGAAGSLKKNEYGNLAATFTAESGSNENNGIKRDITSLLKEKGFTSGDTIKASIDISSSWYGGNATLFVEVNGNRTVLAKGMPADNNDNNWMAYTISGNAPIIFGASDSVYICVTQQCNTHNYDNLRITFTKAASEPSVGETVLNDDFSDGTISGYAAYGAADEIDISCGGAALNVDGTGDWSESYGVKKNITTLVESGYEYTVSTDIANAYWNGSDDGNAKLFFEVAAGSAKTQIPIAEVSADGTISGTAALNFNAGDTVYLCLTQPSGYYQIDNVKIVKGNKTSVTPSPTAAPIVTPTAKPAEDGKDTFDDGNTNGYVVYDSANTGATVQAENQRLKAAFGTGYAWKENNGVKKDVTALVEGGSKYEVSADFETTWWGSAAAKLFFEIVSADGSIKRTDIANVVGEGESGTASLKGNADLWLDGGDTVYLCITQAAGTQYYDNIMLKKVGAATPTQAPTEKPSESPKPTVKPVENVIFADDFSDNAQMDKYGLYMQYDDGSMYLDGDRLVANMGNNHGWSSTNGIRRDITDEISQYISGMTFGARVELDAYWNDNADGKIFFETVSADGLAAVTDIAAFQNPSPGSETTGTAVTEGTAQLNFKPGDKVYLCATQQSGFHTYDNISLWLDNSGNSNKITLTSGNKIGGSFFPESAKMIYSDTFSGGSAEEILAKYTSYKDIPFAAEPYFEDGGVMFQFPDGQGGVHGVVVDVTDVFDKNIPDGSTVRIGAKMNPWWWWGSASVKLRINGELVTVADYVSKTDSPTGWADISGIIKAERKQGDKTEVIIVMNSSAATGFKIDDVCIELPYDTVMARDIAVENADMLANVTNVDIVYGDGYVTTSSVKWSEPSNGIAYGKTEIDGVTARAYITDGNVKKIKVTNSDVSVSDYKLEYGKTVGASGENEMVFLVDSIDNMRLMSAVSGTGEYDKPQSNTTDKSAAMLVRDNGDGITIEGTAMSAAYNDEVILIKDVSGDFVSGVSVHVNSEGKYCANLKGLKTGAYTAIMTDTGITAAFSYASENEFAAFRNKVNSGQPVKDLLKDENNRIILGANTYTQYDALELSAQTTLCEEFAAKLGNRTRAEAAALFDSLVTVQAASSSVSEQEWTLMLESCVEELGLKDVSIYNQYMSLPQKQRESVKSKIDSKSPTAVSEFKKSFEEAVLNTRLVNAGNYSNVQAILKENSGLFGGTGVNVSNLSVNEAKYINSHITDADISIDRIANIVKAALSDADKNVNIGGGGSGGSGGSGSSYPKKGSNSEGISGSNVGLQLPSNLSLNTQKPDASKPNEQFKDLGGYEWAKKEICALAERGIINGYGDGIFKPAGDITREEFVQIIVSAFKVELGQQGAEFTDVDSGRWSYGAISAAANAGIVAGVSNREFAPEANITRQDAAVMIYRALEYKGKNIDGTLLEFTDSENVADYAVNAVTALSSNGIINGMGDGSFSPRALATRAQAAVMIHKVISTLL